MEQSIKIMLALLTATLAWAVASWVLARRRGKALDGRSLFYSAAGALVVTIAGAGLNFMTQPSDAGISPVWVRFVSLVAMPGVALMNVFGRRALDDPIYLAGFALNVFIWSTVLYLFLRRAGRASSAARSAAADV